MRSAIAVAMTSAKAAMIERSGRGTRAERARASGGTVSRSCESGPSAGGGATGGADELRHALHLGREHGLPERGEPVVPPALVLPDGRRRPWALLDQCITEQSAERSIQRPRLELHLA